jgi:hypothetical protein
VQKIGPTCQPPYTVLNPKTRECELQDGADGVVDGQVRLPVTLMIDSGTRLNCKGLKLVPQQTGTPQLATATSGYRASKPELAVVFLESYGAKLLNCVIGDSANPFDHGVAIIGSKTDVPGINNKVLGNTITARYVGITVIGSDQNLIADNLVYFGVGAIGRGISVQRFSNRNHIANNQVFTHSVNSETKATLFPQGVLNTDFLRGINVASANAGTTHFVLNGVLFQSPTLIADSISLELEPRWGRCVSGYCSHPPPPLAGVACSGPIACLDDLDCGPLTDSVTDANASHDNVISGNVLNTDAVGGNNARSFVMGHGRRSRYLGNTIIGGSDGIHFSAIESASFSGTCTNNPGRYCDTAADCCITGIDPATCSGKCSGARTLKCLNWGTQDPVVEGNTFAGVVWGVNISRGTRRAIVRDNEISAVADCGVWIALDAMQDATVLRNAVHDNYSSLCLTAKLTRPIETPQQWGSQVSLNDFIRGTHQISVRNCSASSLTLHCQTDADCKRRCELSGRCAGTSWLACSSDANCDFGPCAALDALPFSAELSVAGQGNYWGHTCDESGGFHDSPSPLVTDSHPYGVSVATTPDALLPATCK